MINKRALLRKALGENQDLKMNNKKAQHEIVGFVLIVVIMVVMGVIFLGISLRKGSSGGISIDDAEIANFLSTSNGYTTNCVLREPFYAELDDVLEGCYNRKTCSDGRGACEVLDNTYSGMIEATWPAGSDRPIKYTKLSAYYQPDAENPGNIEELMDFEFGDPEPCSTNKRSGKYKRYKYPGNLIVELEICK